MRSDYLPLHPPQPCPFQGLSKPRESPQDKTLFPSLSGLARLNRKPPHSLTLSVFLSVLVLHAPLAFQVFNLAWYLKTEAGVPKRLLCINGMR
jgi:hypothetical protein